MTVTKGLNVPWAYRVAGPGFVERGEQTLGLQPLSAGQVRLRFRAGGLCGSDMPLFFGIAVDSVGGLHGGAPIHEIVGDVVESQSEVLRVGQRVVGTGAVGLGLSEMLVESERSFIPVPDELSDVEAVLIQSIATVIRAANRLPSVEGLRVAVVGAGPIGLTFAHVLRQRGAAHITAIDPVPRHDAAEQFGADEFVPTHSSNWVAQLDPLRRPQVIVEAVGHQHATIRDSLRAVANDGVVYGFGAADDDEYSLPYREMYERGLTLMSGRTISNWVDVLEAGRDYFLFHRREFESLVTHSVPVERAQEAYELYAKPQVSRLKVVMVND